MPLRDVRVHDMSGQCRWGKSAASSAGTATPPPCLARAVCEFTCMRQPCRAPCFAPVKACDPHPPPSRLAGTAPCSTGEMSPICSSPATRLVLVMIHSTEFAPACRYVDRQGGERADCAAHGGCVGRPGVREGPCWGAGASMMVRTVDLDMQSSMQFPAGSTPLHLAAQRGQIAILQAMLQARTASAAFSLAVLHMWQGR